MRQYLKNLLIVIDQGINAVLGGSPDETLSGRAYEHYPRLAKFINLITFNPNHCKEAHERDFTEISVID